LFPPPPRPFGPSGPSPRARPPSPSALSALAGPLVSATAFPTPASPALSARGPELSALPSPRNRRPEPRVPQTPRPRHAWSLPPPRPRPLEPRTSLALIPSLICAPAGLPSTSPTLLARQSAAAIKPPPPELVSPSPLEPRHALCHGELRLDVRNPGRAPISPLPPRIPLPALTAVLCAAVEVRHRRLGLPPRLRRHRGVPGVRLEVRNLSRPLPSFLLPPVAFNCSPESLSATAETLRRGSPPSGAPAPTQSSPEGSPRPPQPPRPPRSSQGPAEPLRPSSPASPPPRGRAPPPLLAGGEDRSQPPNPHRPSQIERP
jgi:hypothetical protein